MKKVQEIFNPSIPSGRNEASPGGDAHQLLNNFLNGKIERKFTWK